ncbi:MAG TPA: ABC transporter substrate-binding protein [Candidatus Binatia bacterium]|jgi:sulfonate transport system substrate-binding protein|nr:ABC transporter substrate-binding protein [Candidatus Binatia bacterium]
MKQRALTRRKFLILSGSGLVATAVLEARSILAQTMTIRQGYQTNIWGMPTYYLLRSGALEKRGLKFEEFAVPSGNLTMQQMVARQVDLGTYAGQSFVTGHDKGGLVAIAQIEKVGKTARVMARKELNIARVEQLRGLRIGNQVGSSTGNTFVDIIAPRAGLKKEDYQEVKMNVNEMVAAAAAKSIDAFVSVDPYCSIAEAEGIATTVVSLYEYDPMPVFMAATPEFVEKNPRVVVDYLRAWLDVGKDFKQNPGKAGDVIYTFFTSKGYKMSRDTLNKAMANVEVDPGFPGDLRPYLQQIAEGLFKEKKIGAIPDWKKALRPEFMEKARG